MSSRGFPARLRDARERAGLGPVDLARVLGFKDRRAVWAYEAGRVSPNLALLERLAETLGTTPQWLAYGIE